MDVARRTAPLFGTALLLAGCRQPLSVLPVTDTIVVQEMSQPGGLAVLGDSLAVYCLHGEVRYYAHRLREGQAYKGATLYRYSIAELVGKFPRYNTPQIQEAIGRQGAGKDKRSGNSYTRQ